MTANRDAKDFARLIEALHPWLNQIVVIGGWAHRPLSPPSSRAATGVRPACNLRHGCCHPVATAGCGTEHTPTLDRERISGRETRRGAATGRALPPRLG
jgi:hypothetical protein